ncbi:HAD family hydrolase [Sporosarcina limicola]|uniref:Hydrolase of the HAD superfamily n=1 Tax=Sporosarcina limicola TaxID=34101 RepID=A0A927MML8_9BACL|nr:HAD family hydrolase [Sporosarcina limicola]MBE1556776.1 putative hydrolase of the HAD superfamily [Sporosarcina limicola]
MIKAVLFDLDGTLLNRDASIERFANAQYEHLYEYVKHIPRKKYVSRFIELDCRGYVWKDEVYQQMIEEFNLTGLSWEHLLKDYVDHFKNHCVPFPNLSKMLASLKSKSIVLGIISNGKGKFQINNIKALGIENYFETILISEAEGIKKPDPRIFKKALQKLHVSAADCLFVGDHPENDVKAAQNVGMIGAWKKNLQWSNVDADFIVTDLMEILTIVERFEV